MSGDGTQIGKRLHVVNFGFTLLEEGALAYTASGNHCVAIIKEPEKYQSLLLSLEDIKNEIESLSTIEVNNICFDIEYFLGGDWKFLATITGIDSASANYACIWCKCPALERHDSEIKWSICDSKFGARTIEENIELASKHKKQFNVTHPPIFPKIPLTNIVVDNLHMFLRVADVLIDLLIGALRTLDRVKESMRIRNTDGLTHLSTYEAALKSIGISGFSFWVGKTSQTLKWRSLTGPEKLVLFAKFNVANHFPDLKDKEKIQNLWAKFLEINKLLSAKPEEITDVLIKQFESKSRLFVDDFVRLYPSKHVTPYMHCMMNHVHEFMKSHGSILQFTQQGIEKYNDVMTKDYFRSTSHHKESSLVQILQKQNRVEYLKSMGSDREKRQTNCRNCRLPGHNKLTCKNKCSNCNIKPYCEHLILLNGRKVPRCQQENTK